jgi:hypothetical protein
MPFSNPAAVRDTVVIAIGITVYRLTGGEFAQTRKLVLMK